MTYEEKAAALHSSGCNCCQAVLGSGCEKFHMDVETACRLGAFFGGGMRRGETCGAVTGTLMALGLQYGDENNRKCTKSLEFMREFRQTFGSTTCRELLGADGKKNKGLCPVLIAYCARYLEEEAAE